LADTSIWGIVCVVDVGMESDLESEENGQTKTINLDNLPFQRRYHSKSSQLTAYSIDVAASRPFSSTSIS